MACPVLSAGAAGVSVGPCSARGTPGSTSTGRCRDTGTRQILACSADTKSSASSHQNSVIPKLVPIEEVLRPTRGIAQSYSHRSPFGHPTHRSPILQFTASTLAAILSLKQRRQAPICPYTSAGSQTTAHHRALFHFCLGVLARLDAPVAEDHVVERFPTGLGPLEFAPRVSTCS